MWGTFAACRSVVVAVVLVSIVVVVLIAVVVVELAILSAGNDDGAVWGVDADLALGHVDGHGEPLSGLPQADGEHGAERRDLADRRFDAEGAGTRFDAEQAAAAIEDDARSRVAIVRQRGPGPGIERGGCSSELHDRALVIGLEGCAESDSGRGFAANADGALEENRGRRVVPAGPEREGRRDHEG